MEMPLCSRCKKNLAVVFITKLENGVTTNEGLCLKCAKELGISPINDMMKKMGITEADLENLEDIAANMPPEAMGFLEGMFGGKNEDDDDTVYVSETKFEEVKEINSRQFELDVKQMDLDISAPVQVEETFNIIGQYHNTYILFEEDNELKIVDQHIADERYIFEKLQENLKSENIPSQLLLISDVIPLEPADVSLLMENSDKLVRFGYEIQKISDSEVVFKKIPQVIAHIKVKDILTDILENLHGDLNNLEEKMLVTMSCKAAVKAGAELNLWQMEELIKKWKTTN